MTTNLKEALNILKTKSSEKALKLESYSFNPNPTSDYLFEFGPSLGNDIMYNLEIEDDRVDQLVDKLESLHDLIIRVI